MDVLTLNIVRVFTACVVFCVYLTTAAPVMSKEAEATMYLQKYGYLEETNSGSSSGMIMDEAELSLAIRDFQAFAGLAETGVLNTATLNMMRLPRCGVKDKSRPTGSSRRSKRYAFLGSKYTKRNLTYWITKYPTSLERREVDQEIAKAFKVWSDVTNMEFKDAPPWDKRENRMDIEIRFEKGKHGTCEKFDGPGGALAHSLSPVFGSDVHFDDEEPWTVRGDLGKNLLQVAAHEFGHSLGLDHSKIKSALMFPFYLGYKNFFTLDEDDILGIQKLYGKPKREAEPDSKPRVDPDVIGAPDLCQDSSIDAATVTKNGTYFFKGNYYWKIEDESGISEGYPRKISDDWPGLPGNLDAALTSTNDKTYFFKKNQYWRFSWKKMDSGYPHNISDGFRGIPNDINTVFAWNEDIIFFKGDKYWKYDGSNDPPVDVSYPLPIENWIGLPNNIDAAFQWTNGQTYMFKENKYYRIDYWGSVATANPPYPRSTSDWWIQCENIPDICKDATIDAATSTEHGLTNGTFYVFKGNFYWEIGLTGIKDGYPRRISRDWLGLPGDLDAALTLENGETYFFKKNQYWRFRNKNPQSGYPQNISTGFPGIPDDIDSAFVWNVNQKMYFFKGDKYWRFDNESNPGVSSHYPQPISNWKDLPNNTDAAVRWKNFTLFIKGSQYYKLNDKTPSVAIQDPPYPSYPLSTYFWMFDCEGFRKIQSA